MEELMGCKSTPIEVALGVDENGMTTARKLYDFLELNPSNYSKWYKLNITENEFATENEDYFYSSLSTSEQGRGNFAQDFKLTAHFAKKLTMKGNNERAEQAREYFTRVEERTKQIVANVQNLSPELQLFKQMFDAMARKELEDKERDKRIAVAADNSERAVTIAANIKSMVCPVSDNWREEVTNKINSIQKSSNVQFNILRIELYSELERRAACNLDVRLRNKRQRMLDNGYSKTAVNRVNKMDVIEADNKLREIFSKIVMEYGIKHCT